MRSDTEIMKWEISPDSKKLKTDSVFECKTSGGSQIIRKDNSGGLIFQFFLNKQEYEKVHKYFNCESWTFYKDSVIHFYSGNYIYAERREAFFKITELLNTKIIW